MMYTLVHELDRYDAEYLKRHTNAAYLIGAGRYPVRDPQTRKPLIWIAWTTSPRRTTTRASRIAPCLVRTKPRREWATGLPYFQRAHPAIHTGMGRTDLERSGANHPSGGQRVRRRGTDWQHDRHRWRHLPLSARVGGGYRGLGAHTNGFHSCWAMEMINMLVGAPVRWAVPGPGIAPPSRAPTAS